MSRQDRATHALSDVLDTLQSSLDDPEVSVGRIVDHLGRASFASVMLIFSLISTSPASAIPGVTAVVAMLVLLLIVQMMAGRSSVWLPRFVSDKKLDAKKVENGLNWVRGPVEWVEQFLKPRMTFLFHRPWLWLPMVLIAGLTLFMPFMEIVPTSGSIASAVIALFAASLLTKDGVLACIALLLLSAAPIAIYLIEFG